MEGIVMTRRRQHESWGNDKPAAHVDEQVLKGVELQPMKEQVIEDQHLSVSDLKFLQLAMVWLLGYKVQWCLMTVENGFMLINCLQHICLRAYTCKQKKV
jgi:hypothetical protein